MKSMEEDGQKHMTIMDSGKCALLSDARQLTSTYNTMIRDINQYIEQIVSIEKEKRTARDPCASDADQSALICIILWPV